MAFEVKMFLLQGRGLRLLILSLAMVQTCLLLVMYRTELLPTVNVVNVESIKIYLTGSGAVDEGVESIVKLRDLKIEDFFIDIENFSCFKGGIDLDQSVLLKKCICLDQYWGEDCGVPSEIKTAKIQGKVVDIEMFTPRERPRRIISALPVNHELDLFEARINMHYDAVDIFIVQESNFTNSGQSKELFFKEKLSNGWLSQFQDKILYITRTQQPTSGFK